MYRYMIWGRPGLLSTLRVLAGSSADSAPPHHVCALNGHSMAAGRVLMYARFGLSLPWRQNPARCVPGPARPRRGGFFLTWAISVPPLTGWKDRHVTRQIHPALAIVPYGIITLQEPDRDRVSRIRDISPLLIKMQEISTCMHLCHNCQAPAGRNIYSFPPQPHSAL